MSKRRTTIRAEIAALWSLGWPMLVGQLATVGMAVADVAMTGHYGANDLAAVALGASVWSIIIVTVMGVLMAVNPIVAHHVGAETFDRIPGVVRQALWKALGVGLIAMLVANAATLVFETLSLDPVVRDKAERFVQLISLGLPAFALYRVLYGYSASLNQTKPMMAIALMGLGTNIVGNALLIHGWLGLPELGGVGCAVSTALTLWLMLGAMVAWIRHAPAYRSSQPLRQFEPPHGPTIRMLLKLGIPIGITFLAESSAFGLIALLIARFGAQEVAAHQIALNFSSLVFMVPMSLGLALITRVGQALGEGDPRMARFRAWVGVGVSLAIAGVSALSIASLNDQIAALYTSDVLVAGLAARLLLFAALFQISDAAQATASCAIRGYKVTKPPMVVHMTAFWGFCLPLGCAIGLAPGWLPFVPAAPMGAQGFWLALVVGLTFAGGLLLLMLDRVSRSALRS
jgi:MATE family multidrug resistance protein